ncbi:MAG: TrmH family RNA methyltransferase [Anaerolineales bacterium]|nr:TrmH family RNA methyltransferase [Anaerolineales bacterium]MCL4260338.1 hypothetical protein [Anaerolineales bacterium]
MRPTIASCASLRLNDKRNDVVSDSSFEIRVCRTCGLRYPVSGRQPQAARCPHCLGETLVVESGALTREHRERETPRLSISAERAVILDNIRSAWNVGSILRSAEGFGFSRAHLCGITPTPEHDAVRKTALGAEDSIAWTCHKDAVILAQELKQNGWMLYGLEETDSAAPLYEMGYLRAPMALIVGNEICGVDPGLLAMCERIFYIPMRGKKRSFNVAMAFSAAAYALQAR